MEKNKIEEISKKYSSTKKIMGFYPIYEMYLQKFRDKKINILEIGIEDGNSLKIWSEYFLNARIVGLDILKKKNKYKKY